MFGAWAPGQGYFGQGPLDPDAVVVPPILATPVCIIEVRPDVSVIEVQPEPQYVDVEA